jgi:uncharacterized membrane protein YgcG
MKYTHHLAMASGLLMAAMAVHSAGCNHDPEDCNETLTCMSSGGGAGAGGGDAGLGDGSALLNCDPTVDGVGMKSTVAAACGLCVSSSRGYDSDDPNVADGTPDHPYATISYALGKLNANQSYIYACNEKFDDIVSLSQSVTLQGGLDCYHEWEYTTTPTALTADADAIPLTVASMVTGVQIRDFAITAAAAMKSGGSSIAVVVADSANVTFARCDLTAGVAADGDPGSDGEGSPPPAEGGGPGSNAGTMPPLTGGAGGTNICSGVTLIAGGHGGDGGMPPNGPGGEGTGGPNLENDGAGQQMDGVCGEGSPGLPGKDGAPGGKASGLGNVDVNGYHGISLPTMDGADGTSGESGGGGGGSMAGSSATIHGAGGGGGGAGGCGGLAGRRGQPGGSSIALISLNATVILDESSHLTSGKGGNGGNGGSGQFLQGGGQGGDGGSSSATVGSACAGGKGGDGGNGGNGAGGDGGHSFGTIATGMISPKFSAMNVAFGANGQASVGGNGDADMNGGDAGVAGVCWNFDTNAPCM